MIQTYATPNDAVRVFCGFRDPKRLDQTKFFQYLGDTFMPGTPYMLRPLGLAAYLPGVLSDPPDGLPNEFALICYPSQDVWNHAMKSTLRGRIYNLTHGGVYADTSGADFPRLIDTAPEVDAGPAYLFPSDTDWQNGATCVAVAAKKDQFQSGIAFRAAVRAALLSNREAIRTAHIDQLIAVTREAFAIVWMHGDDPDSTVVVSKLQGLVTAPVVLRNERVICEDEPPTVSIKTNQAFNFVFVRDEKFFLR